MRYLSKNDNHLKKFINSLEGPSNEGVITTTELKEDFGKISEIILNNRPKTGSISERISFGVSNLVRVRKVVADESSHENEDILARAGMEINSGNFTKAIAEVRKLPKQDVEKFHGWLKKVETYLTVQDVAESIFKYVADPSRGSV